MKTAKAAFMIAAQRFKPAIWLSGFVATVLCANSSATTILTFEQFTDSESITTQIPGASFTHTTVITAGISLNELEFPPHSGVNVAFDDGGPIGITFSSPIDAFSGYFTYTVPLTITGYNVSNSAVAQATSAFSSNLALSGVPGSSPNEPLSISFAGGFDSVTIAGAPAGSSFVVDDITFTNVPTAAIPEPSLAIALGFALLALYRSHAARQ